MQKCPKINSRCLGLYFERKNNVQSKFKHHTQQIKNKPMANGTDNP
jgi:hypothetical protein